MELCLDEADAVCDDHAANFCSLVLERDRAG
jgi:hypothetical protein